MNLSIFADSSVGDAVLSTIKNWEFWSAIVATISVIFLGFLLTRKNILKKEWDKVLIKLVMVVGLPALALQGFLSDITIENLKNEAAVLAIGFIFYAVMVMGSRIFFLKYNRDIQDTLSMCVALASTTFFGIPIVTGIFSSPKDVADLAKLTANMFNVPYRVFLYSLAFLIVTRKNPATTLTRAEKKELKLASIPDKNTNPQGYQEHLINKKKATKKTMKNIFLNPILIATFLGVFIWVTQLIPGIECVTSPGVNLDPITKKEMAFSPLRIDLLFPPIAKILSTMQAICTPLAWIAIGMQLAGGNFKQAMKSKTVWYASAIKIVVAPVIILLMTMFVAWIGWQSGAWMMDKMSLAILVIMTASPPASVVVSYTIAAQKEAKLASDLTIATTLLAIIAMPIWVIITTAIGALPIFS